MGSVMYEKIFSQRLAQLRLQKGISARNMSLSIGQNPGYINTIENGKSFPTMVNFFYICEFLNVTPKEFFDFEMGNPEKIKSMEIVYRDGRVKCINNKNIIDLKRNNIKDKSSYIRSEKLKKKL